jgi:hypothetical protein
MSYLRYLCSSLPLVAWRRVHVLFMLFVFVFTSSCLEEGSCLIYVICVCFRLATHIVFCFAFLRLVCPMLPDSLDCPFLNAPSAFFFCVFNRQIPRVAIKNNYIFQFNGILILAIY